MSKRRIHFLQCSTGALNFINIATKRFAKMARVRLAQGYTPLDFAVATKFFCLGAQNSTTVYIL